MSAGAVPLSAPWAGAAVMDHVRLPSGVLGSVAVSVTGFAVFMFAATVCAFAWGTPGSTVMVAVLVVLPLVPVAVSV